MLFCKDTITIMLNQYNLFILAESFCITKKIFSFLQIPIKLKNRRYFMGNNVEEFDDRDMTVDITMEDGTVVTCAIETIFSIGDKDYIALLPDLKDTDEDIVWFYGYSENPDDPNEEPELRYIEDDDEYEDVCDAYDEWLDNADFDEM